jgi:hypothetical protein
MSRFVEHPRTAEGADRINAFFVMPGSSPDIRFANVASHRFLVRLEWRKQRLPTTASGVPALPTGLELSERSVGV